MNVRKGVWKMPEKEEIICMTAEQWREYEIQTSRAEARKRQIRWQEKHIEDKEKRRYFVKQKIAGLIIMIFSLIPFFQYGNLLLLVLFSPAIALGITMIRTDKMVIQDEYYLTHGGLDQWYEDDEDE